MKQTSSLVYVLKGLVPYTRQNLLLTYKPGLFFAELARTSGHSEVALRAAYRRARKSQLITNDPLPTLTFRGRQKLQPFVAKKLAHEGKLLVIFDIPEARGALRRRFRLLLRELEFGQVQQSVWISSYDHRAIIAEAIDRLDLKTCVQMYEAARLFPK